MGTHTAEHVFSTVLSDLKNHRKYDLTRRTTKHVVLLVRLRSLVVPVPLMSSPVMIGGSVVGQTILHVNQRAPEIYRVKFIMKNDITSDYINEPRTASLNTG